MGNNGFDELLAQLVTDEDDKTVLLQTVDKYPALKDGWLRLSDYSRKMNQIDDVKVERDQYKDNLSKWQAWKEAHWDDAANKTKREVELQAQLEEANKKVGTEMGFDEVLKTLDDELSKRGILSKTDFEKTLTDEKAKLVDDFKGIGYLIAKTTTLAGKHLKEFDEPLDGVELFKKVSENGTNDLDSVYDKMVLDKRQERQKAELEAKIAEAAAAAEKAGYEKALAEKAQAAPNGGLPVDQTGSMPNTDFMKRMGMLDKNEGDGDAPPNAELGSGVLAEWAARKFQSTGKS